MYIRKLPKFNYHLPTSLSEALDLLETYGLNAKMLAGGTGLLLAMKKREIEPAHLINIKAIPEMAGISEDEQGLSIGGLTTIAEIECSLIIKEKYSALFDASCVMASPQVRTLATVGGNLVSAVPCLDTGPPLIALSAQAHIASPAGERTCPVEDLFAGPSKSVLAPTDILTRITIPSPKGKGTYIKFMKRAALDISVVGVATQVELDNNICSDVKIALGTAAPTPIRAIAAEEFIRGKVITEETAAKAGKISRTECNPRIDSFRASVEFRRNLVEVLTKRALLNSINR
jgi:aerobic carbon-monoxide dehydrogenase medium subunit